MNETNRTAIVLLAALWIVLMAVVVFAAWAAADDTVDRLGDFVEYLNDRRDEVPDVAITTDVIAGFPGETDADFQATDALCEKIGFAAIHAFPYSRRPGTAANLMPQQLPVSVRRGRLERLLALAEACAQAFRRRHLGRLMPVLWEERKRGLWQGLTPNYLRVYTRADGDLTNMLLPTRLFALRDGGLSGEPERAGVVSV